jgi:F-type H+-transporting ATPase subunit b
VEPINWLSVVLSWLNFGVLLFILIKFGGPAVKEMLATRHHGIKKALDEARTLREQAQGRLTEYEGRLRGIEQEIAALVAGIQREAEAEAARIVKAAEEAATRVRADADFVVKQEVRRIELELRRESAQAAVELARKILQAGMTEDDQRRMAEEFVHQIGDHGVRTARPPTPPAAPPAGAGVDAGWEG